jgi:hypothetical protein
LRAQANITLVVVGIDDGACQFEKQIIFNRKGHANNIAELRLGIKKIFGHAFSKCVMPILMKRLVEVSVQ